MGEETTPAKRPRKARFVFPDGIVVADIDSGAVLDPGTTAYPQPCLFDTKEYRYEAYGEENGPLRPGALVPAGIVGWKYSDGTSNPPDEVLRAVIEHRQEAEYRKNHRSRCPFCKAPLTAEGEVSYDDGSVWIDFVCGVCGRYWQENFVFSGVNLYPGFHGSEDNATVLNDLL